MIERVNWLGEGALTKIDEIVLGKVREVARNPKYSTYPLLNKLTFYISELKDFDDENDKRSLGEKHREYLSYWRKRSASQIIKDGWEMSCSDKALVFVTLARAAKYPARVIEAVRSDWLDGNAAKITETTKNHVFAEVFNEGNWQVWDPGYGPVFNRKLVFKENEYVGIARGIDFTEMYLMREEGHDEEPRPTLTRSALTRAAWEFKRKVTSYSSFLPLQA